MPLYTLTYLIRWLCMKLSYVTKNLTSLNVLYSHSFWSKVIFYLKNPLPIQINCVFNLFSISLSTNWNIFYIFVAIIQPFFLCIIKCSYINILILKYLKCYNDGTYHRKGWCCGSTICIFTIQIWKESASYHVSQQYPLDRSA